MIGAELQNYSYRSQYIFRLFEYFYRLSPELSKIFVKCSNQKQNAAQNILRLLGELNDNRYENYLDIGCGGCLLSSQVLAKLPHLSNVTLIDPSEVMIDLCERRISDTPSFSMANIRYLPIGIRRGGQLLSNLSQKYDIIVCSHIFFWIEDWTDALRQIEEVLNPSGRVFVVILSQETDPNWFEFRKDLFDISHNYEVELESSERLISLVNNSHTNLTVEKQVSYKSFVTFPQVEYSELRASLNSDFKSLFGDLKKFISIIQFLCRKPWNDLNTCQREQIINQIRAKNGRVISKLYIPEKLLLLKAR